MSKWSLSACQLRIHSTCPSLFLTWQASLPASCPGARQEEVDASWQPAASGTFTYMDEREAHAVAAPLPQQPLLPCAPHTHTHAVLQLCDSQGVSEQRAVLNNYLFHLSCDHTQWLSVATAVNKVTCMLCNATDRTGSRKKKFSLNCAVSLLPTCHLWWIYWEI